MKIKAKEVYKKALCWFGTKSQVDMAIEEMSELIQALSKSKRGLNHNVAEEIADVMIMLNQMIILFDCKNEVELVMNEKIIRLNNLIAKERAISVARKLVDKDVKD